MKKELIVIFKNTNRPLAKGVDNLYYWIVLSRGDVINSVDEVVDFLIIYRDEKTPLKDHIEFKRFEDILNRLNGKDPE